MGNKSSENRIAKVIKNFWAPITSCIGAITSIVQFVELWKGNRGTTTWVICVLALFFFLFILIHVGFSKKKPGNGFVTLPGYKSKQPSYPKYFKLARYGLIITLLIISISGYFLITRLNELDEKVIVVIAGIEGEDSLNIRFTENLIAQLQDSFQDYDKVMIIPLNYSISEQQGSKFARKEGAKWHADLVIWGWYAVSNTDALITVHVENANKSNRLPMQDSELNQVQAAYNEIQSFSLQQNLADKMTYLVTSVTGIIYFEAGDPESALELLSNIEFEDEFLIGRTEVLYYRASAHFDLKQFNESINDLNAFILSNPNNPDAYVTRGNAYYEVEQYESAISDYTTAINLDPYNPSTYHNMGRVNVTTGNYNEAINNFHKAIELNPNDPLVSIDLGLAYIYTNQYEKAASRFGKALSLDSNNPTIYVLRGNAYTLLKKYEDAIIDYSKAIEIDPLLSTAYLNRGNVYAAQTNYEEAYSNYKKSIEIDPNSADAHYNLGILYFNQDEPDKSISSFSKAIEISPQKADAYINRGNVYATTGEYNKAIIDFNEALKLSDGNAKATKRVNDLLSQTYNDLGAVQLKKYQYKEALDYLDKSILHNPELAIAFYNRSIALAMLNQFEAATIDMQKYLEILKSKREITLQPSKNTDEDAKFILGYNLYSIGYILSFEEGHERIAIEFFDKAIKFTPDFAEAYYSRGIIYYKLGFPDQAVENLNTAIQLKPQMGLAYYNRGIIFADLHQDQMAIADFNKVLEIYKDTNMAILEDVRNRIEEITNKL